jgi:hypothetical protein
MAAETDYIPAADADFSKWQGDLVDMIGTNGVAWGIPTGKVTEIQAKRTSYDAKYTAAETPSTRTTGTVSAHRSERTSYEKYIRKFVKEFLAGNSAVTVQQRKDMKINTGEPSGGSRAAITSSPHTSMKSLGGGFMQFENRVEGDSTRPSRHKASDGLEVRYAILPYRHTAGAGSPPPPPPSSDDSDLPTPEECPNQHFSTKARFKLELGSANIGKVIIAYPRWKNNATPEKSGPYTSLPVIQLIG